MRILDLSNDTLNEYEQIVLFSLSSYLRVHPHGIEVAECYNISQFLCINSEYIERLLKSVHSNEFEYTHLRVKEKVMDLSDFWFNYGFFECLLNYYNIKKCIHEISISNDESSLKKNYKLYHSAAHSMNMMNTQSGAYECIYRQKFSKEYAPQSFKSFYPNCYIDFLELYSSPEYYKQNSNLLSVLYRIINYEITTHANAMYLIIVSQILKHSPFHSAVIHNIAEEMYDNLHNLLRDARVISIQFNHLFQDVYKDYNTRCKASDNTTRLQILYGFDNYDSYSLRLDLSHAGVGWIHFNNESPGGIKSYFFSKSEYESVVSNTPSLKKCFINYGEKWFLKELMNCDLNREEKVIFELEQKKKDHFRVFQKTYSEKNVIHFLSTIKYFLFNFPINNVDRNGQNARFSFNHDKLMSWLESYYIFKSCSDISQANILMKHIVNKAVEYRIISATEIDDFYSEDGLQLIIDLSYERCL